MQRFIALTAQHCCEASSLIAELTNSLRKAVKQGADELDMSSINECSVHC